MARNKKAVNGTLFGFLDSHCAAAGDPVRNASSARWVDTSGDESTRFLTNARLIEQVSYSASRQIARFDLDGISHFCAIGFDYISAPPQGLTQGDVGASELTLLLSTLRPRPRASSLEIRNLLEAGDGSSEGYGGYDPDEIRNLFPPFRMFATPAIDASENWRIFFALCVTDCSASDSWIDDRLSSSLLELSKDYNAGLPYKMICRSVFDYDPASLFMALYRSMEYIFSFSGMRDTIANLALSVTWSDLQVELEEQTGWRPKEEFALRGLFKAVPQAEIRDLAVLLGVSTEAKSDEQLSEDAADKLYKLRNSIVHYRPAHANVALEQYNWPRLCQALSKIVLELYRVAFP